jgi:membrane-associated protease RseP (regulator of RpoE activity)
MPSGEARESGAPPLAARPLSWRLNAWLFAATVASAFLTWIGVYEWPSPPSLPGAVRALEYTGALLSILLAHEFGHYIAARVHKVDASLPYFIPMPFVSPFGTFGAVIRMRSVIPTRRALLDIGAAGPLAGLALAIPLYAWGVAHSSAVALDAGKDGELVEWGSSLLERGLDRMFAPPVPEGMDLSFSPVAFAAWVGMFVTMINLLPVGQLDGGHVAFALFGSRQNKIARWVHRSMLAFFFVGLANFLAHDVRAGLGLWRIGRHVQSSLFWLMLFEILAVLGSISAPAARAREGDGAERHLDNRTRVFATLGLALLAWILRDKTSALLWSAWFVGLGVLLAMEARWGALQPSSGLLDHPPSGEQPLSWGRAALAVITLAFFALLFMPTPVAI